MNKQNSGLRTYPSKGLIIFYLSVSVISLLAAVGTFFLIDNLALKIVLWIFLAIFFVLSLIVLLFEAINYLSFNQEEEFLVIHKLIKKKVPLSELSRIENKDGFYVFLKGKKEIYRIGTEVTGVSALIVALEKRGIKIKW